MTISRRQLFSTGAAAVTVGMAAGVAAPAAAAPHTALRSVRIRTGVGTFDALAAGPRRGRPVLLLHGFPERGLQWSAQLRALAAVGFRAVAPDQRGYSGGVRPSRIADYHLDAAVCDVARLADGLGWREFDVVGHDWGACVAWLAAARFRCRVRSLTAISVPHPAAFAEALRTDPVQQEASTYMDGFRRPTPVPENEIRAGGPPKLDGVPAWKAAHYYRELTTERGALTAALNWYRANDFTGFEADLVDVPTLFVSGDDPMVAPSGVAATPRWVTGSYRNAALTGVGHFIPESAPEKVSALLLKHLRAH